MRTFSVQMKNLPLLLAHCAKVGVDIKVLDTNVTNLLGDSDCGIVAAHKDMAHVAVDMSGSAFHKLLLDAGCDVIKPTAPALRVVATTK